MAGQPARKAPGQKKKSATSPRTSRTTSSAANNELGDLGPTEPWSPGWCDFRSNTTWSRSVAASPHWWRRTVFPSEILIVAGGGARPLHRQIRIALVVPALIPDASSDSSSKFRSGTRGTTGTGPDIKRTQVNRLGAERSQVQSCLPDWLDGSAAPHGGAAEPEGRHRSRVCGATPSQV